MDPVSNGGFLISKIQKLSKRIFAQILKENGLVINPGQGRILYVLWQKDGIPIQELAQKTSLTTSTLTSMLDRMEQAKILTRIPKPDDRRSYLITLTPQTIQIKETYLKVSKQMTQIYYQGLSPAEIANFEDILSRIFTNLENYGST